jgi:hypothetical protein
VLFVDAREPEEIADDLRRAVSPVREGNMVKTDHLPGAVRIPQRFSLCAQPGTATLRDILFYM